MARPDVPAGADEKEVSRFHASLGRSGISPGIVSMFREIILSRYQRSGRSFPWRETTDPYAILVSEIMLQQTQTDRVVPKYLDFLEAFPDFDHLAAASLKDVLAKWQGLGYNRRGKALRDAAQMVVERFGGKLPDFYEDLLTFPGIGPYTAGAVCAFAFDQPVVFMDTNIRRVFIHFFFPDREGVRDSEIVPLVEKTLDRKLPREWYSALMDYGALLKGAESGRKGGGKGKKEDGKGLKKDGKGTKEGGKQQKKDGKGGKKDGKVERNPNRRSAHYAKQSPFEGSDRQIRGAILRELLGEGGSGMKEHELAATIGKGDRGERERVRYILDQLEREGFVREEKGRWMVPEE